MRGIHKVILPGVVLLLSLSTSMFAQGNATLSGAVTDSTGAVIPGAVVTVTNDTTGMAPTRVTNESGNYEFTNLLPGSTRSPPRCPALKRESTAMSN